MRSCLLCLGLFVVSAALTGCDGSRGVPTEPTIPAGPTVRLVYARPQDRPFRADYVEAIQYAFADLRAWYREQVGGPTFWLYRSDPDSCQLPESTGYYRVDTWTRVLAGVQGCLPVTYNSTDFSWVLYADVVHECNAPGRIGAASGGVAILGRGDLDGLVGEVVIGDCGYVEDMPLGRWIGGAGHELAHTFGLPHPPGCAEGLPACDRNSLMWLGYRLYPNTYLSDQEKERLRASPFFR